MGDALVLCYHAVSERFPAPLSVTPAALHAQLSMLAERGYRGVTFTQLVQGPRDGRRLAVTFDDAYASVAQLARPILDELGMPGTVFVPTGHVGTGHPMAWPGIDRWHGTEHEGELVGMSWEDLRALSAAGWEVGSHTRSHPRLTGLGNDELRAELEGSRRECEEALGEACVSIAYPYGDVDSRVAAAAGAAGYRTGAALPGRPHRAESLRWPRVGVYHGDGKGRFRLKASCTLRALRGSAWRRP
jgi:peptidoglycan/xylan/chitin deacetylase (PgdA/CDA1 family)